MLFVIVQEHEPALCPAQEGLGPEILFDGDAPGIELRSAVADVPGHRLVFVVEADSYDAVSAFLEPGRTRCTVTVSPVRDLLTT